MTFDAKIFFKKNAPLILTVTSVAGLVGTVVLAVKATPKATAILKEKQEEKEEPLTTLEKVKYAAPVYIPTVLTGLGTAACIIGTGVLNEKQIKSLAAGYTLLADRFTKYQHKVKEIYGEEAHREILRQIDLAPCDPPYLYACGCFSNAGFELPEDRSKRLFYDTIAQVYFESTYEEVLQALYHLNRNYILRHCAGVCEYHEFLGLKDCPDSELGWTMEDGLEFVDFDIIHAVTDDGLEYYMISPAFEPTAVTQYGWW